MYQGQRRKDDNNRSEYVQLGLAWIHRDGITDGELPTAPMALFLISIFRIWMAIPRAAVVNAILMNLKSYYLVNRRVWKSKVNWRAN